MPRGVRVAHLRLFFVRGLRRALTALTALAATTTTASATPAAAFTAFVARRRGFGRLGQYAGSCDFDALGADGFTRRLCGRTPAARLVTTRFARRPRLALMPAPPRFVAARLTRFVAACVVAT